MAEIREEWLHSRLRDLMATGSDQLARGCFDAAADTLRTALQILPADEDPGLRAELDGRLATVEQARSGRGVAMRSDSRTNPQTAAPAPPNTLGAEPQVGTDASVRQPEIPMGGPKAENLPVAGPVLELIEPPSFALLEPSEPEDRNETGALLTLFGSLLGITLVLFWLLVRSN
jgi:hypothetical protein